MRFSTRHLFSLTSLIIWLFVLAGCSSQPLAPPSDQDFAPNAQLWHWQAQGRLAVKDGQEHHSANLDWQQEGFAYQIMIFGPLGQGSARLDGQPFHVTLTTAEGESLEASSPEQLIRQGLGWDLPLSNLIYWVRGLPAPGPYQLVDTNNLIQGSWEVEWRRFIQVEGYTLPSLLIARQGQFELRLAINSWQLEPDGLKDPKP